MTETTDRELGLQEEDRLPWLEAVESDDENEGLSGGKLVLFLMAALLALGLVIGGIWWLRSQKEGPTGDGTLIAAQEGDYKVKPDEPGGMKVEGQGDSAFATSEGVESNGQIDQRAMPEAPIAGTKGPATIAPTAPVKSAVTTVVPASGGKLVPPATAARSGAGNLGSGTIIQLGAYGTKASADQAWAVLAAKHAVLGQLNRAVVPAVVGGNTYYRLRANAGSAGNAAATCRQVGNCIVVR